MGIPDLYRQAFAIIIPICLITIYYTYMNYKVVKKIHWASMVIFIMTIILSVINCYYNLFYALQFIVGITGIFVALFIFLYLIIKFSNRSLNVEIKGVSEIDNLGFKISTTKISKKTTSNEKRYFWKDINSVKFEETLNYNLTLNGKEEINLDKTYSNLFALVLNIPSGKLDEETKQQVELIKKSFETCKICGTIAVYNEVCRDCGCLVWNDEIEVYNSDTTEYYSSAEEYIKAEQLETYATMEENEKVEDFIFESEYFEFDSNWQPSITKADVLKYSEENFWNMDDDD